MPPKRTHSAVTASPVSRKRQRGEEVDIEPHNQGSSNAAQCKASVMESDTAAHVSPFLRDSSDSGPLCIDLEPSESSDGASTSTGDARPGRLAEVADELKADDVPSNTDDMMNVLTSAIPELRGSLAERARSLLAAGRTPLAAMLRSVVRYTVRGTPPGNQIAGRSTRSEDPSQSTLKKTEENQPPELSYLLTPSPRCEQSNSNLGLVSFTTLPNTPASSSKCDSVPGTDVRSTSPTKLPTEQQENPGSQGNRTKQQNTLLNYFNYVKKYQHVDSTNQTQTPKIDGNPANVEKEFLNQTNCQLEGTKKNTETQSEDTADIEKAKNKADLMMEIEKHSDDKPNKANDNGTETETDDVLIVNETLPDIVDLTALDSPEVNTTPMKFEPISSDKDSTIINLTIQDDDDDDDMFRTVSDATSAHTETLINDMDEIDDLLPAVILPKPIPMNSVPLKQESIQAEPAEAKPATANSQARSARADRRVRKRGRRGPRAPRGPRGPRTSFETPRPGFQDIANDLYGSLE